MTQTQSLLYLLSMFIPLFTGIAMLIVWNFDRSQKFVRDFAFSTLATALFTLGFLTYLQNVPPVRFGAMLLTVCCATLNLGFLISSMNRLAQFKLSQKQIIGGSAVIFLVLMFPPSPGALLVKSSFALIIQVVLGAFSTARLWRKKSVERYLGPLVILLGLSQLIVILGVLKYIHIQALEAALIRVVIGFIFLFSALHRSKREIKKAFDQFKLMTEQSPQGVLVLNDQTVLYSNVAAQKIYGCTSTAELNQVSQNEPSSPIDSSEFHYYYQKLQEQKMDTAVWGEKHKRADGKVLSLTFTAWLIEWEHQLAAQILITDETDLINSAMALSYQETHDELTGLANRRMLIQQLHRYCYMDEHHATCILTILNINRFKLFNQGQGHVIGDQVLLELSRKLSAAVGVETEVMRIGGDEFGLITISVFDIEKLNAKLIELCKQPLQIEGRHYFISLAIGQAMYPVNARNADGLLRAANAAMHQAKKIPGTSIVMADAKFEESLSRAMEQEQELKNAIIKREITLFYQPKVDALTHQLMGFEALARWIRPGKGNVNPAEFIAVAEKTALINDLGSMLLDEACSQIATWYHQFGDCVPVAVNVSPIQLLDPNFSELIRDVIAKFNIPPRLLTLEITESAAINDLDQTQQQISQLQHMGIHVAMDDFGTGYSSLSMLRRLRVQTLKIDRALIDPLPSQEATAIVVSICQLAKALNMHVVAEGVETTDQSEAARKAGCHELQGYLFAKPLLVDEAQQWLVHRFNGELELS